MLKTKFTRIKKWAEENDYPIIESEELQMLKVVTEKVQFDISNRESSIYHSVKGLKGDRAGLYMSIRHKAQTYSSVYCFYYSQKEIIETMEETLKYMK